MGTEITENPLGINESPGPSPEQEQAIEVKNNTDIAERIRRTKQIGPSVRQQTQTEIINLTMLFSSLGGANPFSIRRLPFSILRDMTTDAMISYAFYYTINPLINAEMFVESEDAQLAAAVDAAFRPINASTVASFAQSIYYGYSPEVKRWKLGPMEAKYRDRHSTEPEKDLEVWASSVDVILPKETVALPPENCIPKWDENGKFNGFVFSTVPLPDPLLFAMGNQYTPDTIQGYNIPLEDAIWVVNERQENFNSIYGSPRTKRAYRYWWSYWYRWALADRAFELKADPAKLVYYPTQMAEVLDVNDNNPETSTPKSLEQQAIRAGMNARSGSVVALPGDFMTGDDGKTIPQRAWEMKYLEGGDNFDALDKSFQYLDVQKLRAMLLPEQAFLDSNVTGQGSSQRYVATQMGEIYKESMQLLIDEYDTYKNNYMVPQFVAAMFPDKTNIPVRIKTGGLGAQNDELVKQIITIVGQKNPRDLHVNVRELLAKNNVPLLTKAQQDAEFKKELKEAKEREPEVMAPTKKEGTQGYNAGVEKTTTGESIYVNGPQVINLSSSDDFLRSLPNIPPYSHPIVRSNAMRLRKTMLDRYKTQIKTFADRIRDKITMKLADEEEKHKYGAGAAKLAAEAAVAAWLADQTADVPEIAGAMSTALANIVVASGVAALKQANLDTSVYKPEKLTPWVHKFTDESIKSVDHTIREELISFLTDQLQQDSDTDKAALALEDHFSEFPQTHADRLIRHQTRDAYNMGMLQAADDAGISQVLAHDASDGSNTATDMLCQKRNGKVLTPREAMGEKEHPNGTLYFTYLTTENLSLQITDEIPENLEVKEAPGIYDPKSETLYIKSEFANDASNWILALGKRLEL